MKKVDRILIPDNPVGADKVCAEIQNKLGAEFDWLDHLFGKAQIVETKKGKVPRVFYEKNDYLDVLPDEKYGSFSFMMFDDPEGVDVMNGGFMSHITVRMGLIFWIDLSLIGEGRRSEEVKELLRTYVGGKMKLTSGSFTLENISERVENIYKGLTVSEIERQFLMQPYYGLRLDGLLTCNVGCNGQ